ncbi:MAG: glycosyltransferase [Acidithiobacillus sp.]|nr:glycosyltransferase [Acidithiobacillus sp.]
MTTLTPSSSSPQVVLVLGMHRSGTSLLTGFLQRMGFYLGETLLPPEADNPKGFFENSEIVALHDQIFDRIGMRWDDPRPMPQNWLKFSGVSDARQQLGKLLDAQFHNRARWAVKDPRLCRLFPLWDELLRERRIRPQFILLLRNPREVAKSLQSRSAMPLPLGEILWFRYVFESLQHSAVFPRLLLHFDQVHQNRREAIQILADFLGIPSSADTLLEAEALFDPQLRHHALSNEQDRDPHTQGYAAILQDLYRRLRSIEVDLDSLEGLALRLQNEDENNAALFAALEISSKEKHQAEVQRNEAIALNALQAAELGEIRTTATVQEQELSELRSEKERYLALETRLWELEKEHDDLSRVAEERLAHLQGLMQSHSWRFTRPLRSASTAARALKNRAKGIRHLWLSDEGVARRYTIARGIYHRLPLPDGLKRQLRNPARRLLSAPIRNQYHDWIAQFDSPTDAEREAIRRHQEKLPYRPLISILLPVYNPPLRYLQACLDSVLAQSYPHWELCIIDDASPDPEVWALLERYVATDARIVSQRREENGHISRASNDALNLAQGEFFVLLDHDDMLSVDALYYLLVELNEHPNAVIIYSDEDKIDAEGQRLDPYFKPDFSYDLFLGQNMISHMGAYRTSAARAIGGFRPGYEGAQDWDLAIRILERIRPEQIRHIPRVLYHWRVIPGSTALDTDEKPYAHQAQWRVLTEHLQRMGSAAQIVDHPRLPTAFHRVIWPQPNNASVSIIIPTRNGLEYLRPCISSILEKTSYPNFEIIVVDNGSDAPDLLAYLEQISGDHRVRVLRYPAPFNYSAINNFAVKQSGADVVVLLNNDTEVISGDWLDEMVSHALRPDVGAVGAKLLYEDGTVQHGGVILGLGGYAAHSHRGFPGDHPGQSGRLWLAQDYAAVTAACLAIARSKYWEVSGLDEEHFPVAYNDVDFCLRLRQAGYRNIFTPYAELYHYESKTRGADDLSASKRARFTAEKAALAKRHKALLPNDPFYNPNLTLDNEDFALAFPPRLSRPWESPGNPAASGLSEVPKAQDRLVSVDRFQEQAPNPRNILQVYAGTWVSIDPDKALGENQKGDLQLLREDYRIVWAMEQLKSVAGFRILELGPLEGRQTYSLCRHQAKEVVAVEGNADCFQRLLAFKAALNIACMTPLLGNFLPYLDEAETDSFDLVFASGVLYHLPDPLAALTQMIRVAPRLYLWTHVYDPELPQRHPGWAARFQAMERWTWKGVELSGARQSYVDQGAAGFCGGLTRQSLWLTEESLLIALHALGYRITAVHREPEHPNGVAIGITAERDVKRSVAPD